MTGEPADDRRGRTLGEPFLSIVFGQVSARRPRAAVRP